MSTVTITVAGSRPCFRYAYLTYCALTASLGFVFYGYYIGQLNDISRLLPCTQLPAGLSPQSTVPPFLGLNLPPCIPMSTIQFSFANAILPLGGVSGAVIFGYFTQRFGRVRAMQLQTIPYIVAPLALAFSNSYAWILVGRFVAGIGTGGAATTVPIYLNEISPPHLRGTIGSLSGTAIASGLACATLLGFFFGTAVPDWRWIMTIPFIVALVQAVLLLFCVESPKWLGSHLDEDKKANSVHAYSRLGHDQLTTAPVRILDEEAAEAVTGTEELAPPPKDARSQHVSVKDFVTQPGHRTSFIILALAFGSQQLCGIKVYYAYSFFVLTLVLSRSATSLFYLIFAFSVIPISYFSGMIVDRFGRRPLMLGAMVSMAISSAILAISVVLNVTTLTLVMFVGGVIIFSAGLGNIPFILVSEVVEPMAVSAASTVSQMANLLSQFIVLFVFPLLLNSIGAYTFLVFTGYLAIAAIALAMILPETKGRTSAEVVSELRARRNAPSTGASE